MRAEDRNATRQRVFGPPRANQPMEVPCPKPPTRSLRSRARRRAALGGDLAHKKGTLVNSHSELRGHGTQGAGGGLLAGSVVVDLDALEERVTPLLVGHLEHITEGFDLQVV